MTFGTVFDSGGSPVGGAVPPRQGGDHGVRCNQLLLHVELGIVFDDGAEGGLSHVAGDGVSFDHE